MYRRPTPPYISAVLRGEQPRPLHADDGGDYCYAPDAGLAAHHTRLRRRARRPGRLLTGPGMRKARNLHRDPRMALSIAPVDNPFEPVVIRGRVVEWIDGDAAWQIIDRLATKYTGAPYPRGQERVVAVIEPERQTVGVS
jgi:hypothetical protein